MNPWMNHPKLRNMEPIKRQLIEKAFDQTRGKTGQDLAPVLMALITAANKRGIRFTSEEIQYILDLLKEGKSQKEQQNIDHTVDLVQSMKKRADKRKD